MATETENAELIQENIDEYVNDENKVVTCRWLSLTLDLNINTAKNALYSYVDGQRNKGGNDDVNVTYFVAGLGKSKSGQQMHKCVVVTESELDAVKKSLTTVTSCHIYSVQKAKLKDYVPLYATDYDVIKDNIDKCARYSSIECSWASLKPQKQVVRGKEKTDTSIKTEKNGNVPTPPSNTVASKASTKKAEPKGSISSMFAKAGGKEKSKETTDKQSGKADPDKGQKGSKVPEKKTGMMSYFGKQAAGDSVTASTGSTKAGSGKDSMKNDKKGQAKESQQTNKQTSKKKKAEDLDDEGPERKRRRRIQTNVFDSSEEEDANSEEEEPEEPEIEVPDSPPICNDSKEVENEKECTDLPDSKNEGAKEDSSGNGNSREGKRRKGRMKTVSKQYVDEEGFMVTKKVSEWESGSDLSEDEKDSTAKDNTRDQGGKPGATSANQNVGPKEKPIKGKQAPKKPAASPQKGKQTSLMSFFKKK